MPTAILDTIIASPSESLRPQIADVFTDNLGERFAWPILPFDRSELVSLISSSLSMSNVYAGLDGAGSMLAFAFVTDDHRELLCLKKGWLREIWGAWGGTWRGALMRAVHFGQDGPCTLHIEAFVVRPEWRGKGIGAQLMARILADARAKGHKRVTVDVDEESLEARNLYEDLGFRVVRTMWVPCQHNLGIRNVLMMRLDL